MENIILELRKGEKENIYGGEGRVVYVLNEEGKCIPRYIVVPLKSKRVL